MISRSLALLCGATLFLYGCSGEAPPPGFKPESLRVPAEGHATGPRLSSSSNNELLLSWMMPHSGGTTLRYSRFANGSWGPSSTVADDPLMFVNWADLPSVVPLDGGRIAAHWLSRKAKSGHAYDVLVTQSADDGATWSDPMHPYTDGTPTEHGFASIFPDGPRVGLIWLNGRNTDDGMALRTAVLANDDSLQNKQLVDNLVCDCCQTDVAMSSSGPIVVYRNRSPDEIRDIYVARYRDNQWLPGRTVADDGWHIEGCPVNGPAIDASGQYVAIAWFSAADSPVVRFSLSVDGGASFSAAIDIGSDNVLGRVGVAITDDGRAAVSWLQKVEGGRGNILVRQIVNGESGPIQTVATSASLFSVPQLDMAGTDLIFAWTEKLDDEQAVVSAKVPFAALLAISD